MKSPWKCLGLVPLRRKHRSRAKSKTETNNVVSSMSFHRGESPSAGHMVWNSREVKAGGVNPLQNNKNQRSNLLSHSPPVPVSLCSWWAASLIWRRTSSSRTQKASAACWDCWSTVTPAARRKSGACSLPSCARVFAICRPAPRWALSIRCCPEWVRWTKWSQVRWPLGF